MHIKRLMLKHFRCFESKEFIFDAPVILIQGPNGSGKTSLLEALHYACYMRSFRAQSSQDLISFGHNAFFVGVSFQDDDLNKDLHIGCSRTKRNVKLNGHTLSSHKELLAHFRVVTITEHDLSLICETPEVRRAFIDQAISLHKPEYTSLLKQFRQTLYQRNALIAQRTTDKNLYRVWSDQLFAQSALIKEERLAYMAQLSYHLNQLIAQYVPNFSALELVYHQKQGVSLMNSADIAILAPKLEQQEYALGRSLYGAHLDDIAIMLNGRLSRLYASRGQQKLVVLLIKMAQVACLTQERGKLAVLLDDFMTDFDDQVALDLISMLCNASLQLFFTSPLVSSPLDTMLASYSCQRVVIS